MKFLRSVIFLMIAVLCTIPAAAQNRTVILIDADVSISNTVPGSLRALLQVLSERRPSGTVGILLCDDSARTVFSGSVTDSDVAAEAVTEAFGLIDWDGRFTDPVLLSSELVNVLTGDPARGISDVYLFAGGLPHRMAVEEYYNGLTPEAAAEIARISRALKLTGANFHVAIAGFTNADPVLQSICNADTIFLSVSTNYHDLYSGFYNSLNTLEIATRNRIGQFSREKKITLHLRSHYPQSTVFTLRGVYLHDVGRAGIISVTNSANLLPASVSVYLKPEQETNITVKLFPAGKLGIGKYTAVMEWTFDSGVSVTPSAMPVTFKVGGYWIFWLILAAFVFYFKYYFLKAFRELEKTHAGEKIVAPFRKLYRNMTYRTENYRRIHPKFAKFFEAISEGIDNLAIGTMYLARNGIRIIILAIRIALVFLLKGLSRFVILFPIGTVFEKTGSAMLKLDSKIKNIKTPKWKKDVSLKMDLKKISKIR